jgi:DNA-nicking Smr family endonuclease
MPDGKDESGDDFASLMGDAKPLKRRKRLAAPSRPRPSEPEVAARAFVFPQPEEPLLAHASDCELRRFDELRRGRVAIDDRADLHGLRKVDARELLVSALRTAWDEAADCVLVIHGRGRSSESEPVLKLALPEWLTTPPLATRVLAFAPAKQRDGGGGATYVLLRSQ